MVQSVGARAVQNFNYTAEKTNPAGRIKKLDAPCLIIGGLGLLLCITGLVLLIIGCCGLSGAIPMSIVGANVMVTIGGGLIIGMIMGIIKACCR